MAKDEFLSPIEAAMIINKNYAAWSMASSIHEHVRRGNITQYYPMLAIVNSDGKVIQEIGKSKKPFFLKEQVEHYAIFGKIENNKNGRNRTVFCTNGTEKKRFSSIRLASDGLGIEYNKLARAIRKKEMIDGWEFSSTAF